MLQKQMKALAVVTMTQVAEFMQHDIVTERCGKTDNIEIQVDIAQSRATAPVCRVMLDDNSVICKAISGSKLGKTLRKFGLCLSTQRLDLMGIGLLDTLVAFMLTSYSLYNPFSFEFEECDRC